MVALPIIDGVLAGGRIHRFFEKVISFAMGTFGKLIISYIVISAAFAALSWALMRKAPVRQ